MGVRPDHRPELPDELAHLGARLETAAAVQLARRARLRRSLARGASAVLVGIPLALVVATADLAPSARPVDQLARTVPSFEGASLAATAFVLDRVPDKTGGGRPCVMVPDCRYVVTIAGR